VPGPSRALPALTKTLLCFADAAGEAGMRRGLIAGGVLLIASVCSAQIADQEIERFALAFMTYYPGSVATITDRKDITTPAGKYVAVQVERTTPVAGGTDHLGLLIDPKIRTAAAGLLFPMPPTQPAVTQETLPYLVTEVLPQVLGSYLSTRVKIPFPMTPTRPGGVLFLTGNVTTGYGTMPMPLALSTDGRYVAIGGSWPLDRDPRAVRRDALENAYIQWDPGHEKAVVKVIEFSDFECPACKRGWGIVKPVMSEFGDRLRHGMVNWPIVSAHPWSFRAAVAGECVYSLWPDKLLALKEQFYRLQDNLTDKGVDAVVYAFLAENQLADKPFTACYMKDPAIDTVLKQMALGYQLGVFGTPTYYANGESLPWGDVEVFRKRLAAIIAAGGRPETAAEVTVTPKTPTPAPTPNPTAEPRTR
jgi:hypothetical protein